MGNFSRDTFDRLKHYVGVRLQQGVPIVDADWNELEDIRKYELQAFLKWFVGNGVPMGSDGFNIKPIADAQTDFLIEQGRCLVEGWDVINEEPMKYTDQPLYKNPDWADKDRWNVEPLLALTIPTAPRIDEVYLDVWEREVNAAEDSDLVNNLIGLETCVRRKREWVVRVAEGMPFPEPGPGHYHYHLATMNRPAGQAAILEGDITDRRMTGLAIPSYLDIQQMSLDAFGLGYTLDHDGQPNLKVSLREAINALLHGNLPGTPETQLVYDAAEDYATSALKHSNGDIWLFFRSMRSGNQDIWYKRYSATTSTWGPDTRLTTNTGADSSPFALEDRSGNIWVFWSSNRTGNLGIWYNRYSPTSNSWSGDNTLMTARTSDLPFAVIGSTGDIWVFWNSFAEDRHWHLWCNRYNSASDRWMGESQLTTYPTDDLGQFAIVDTFGDIWIFWSRFQTYPYSEIWYKRYSLATSGWGPDTPLAQFSGSDIAPFAIADDMGDIWVFWSSNRTGNFDIWYNRYSLARNSWSEYTQLTTDNINDYSPKAIIDSQGGIWVFWHSGNDISYKRYSRDGGWGRALALTAARGINYEPIALEDNSGEIWLFWNRDISSNTDVWYRKILLAI